MSKVARRHHSTPLQYTITSLHVPHSTPLHVPHSTSLHVPHFVELNSSCPIGIQLHASGASKNALMWLLVYTLSVNCAIYNVLSLSLTYHTHMHSLTPAPTQGCYRELVGGCGSGCPGNRRRHTSRGNNRHGNYRGHTLLGNRQYWR